MVRIDLLTILLVVYVKSMQIKCGNRMEKKKKTKVSMSFFFPDAVFYLIFSPGNLRRGSAQ